LGVIDWFRRRRTKSAKAVADFTRDLHSAKGSGASDGERSSIAGPPRRKVHFSTSYQYFLRGFAASECTRPFMLGAATFTLGVSFFGFFASRFLCCSRLAMVSPSKVNDPRLWQVPVNSFSL
jgi:hypothetical protein